MVFVDGSQLVVSRTVLMIDSTLVVTMVSRTGKLNPSTPRSNEHVIRISIHNPASREMRKLKLIR